MKQPKERPFKPRLKKTDGKWYAHAPNNSHRARCYLWPAIGWVKQMNQKGL